MLLQLGNDPGPVLHPFSAQTRFFLQGPCGTTVARSTALLRGEVKLVEEGTSSEMPPVLRDPGVPRRPASDVRAIRSGFESEPQVDFRWFFGVFFVHEDEKILSFLSFFAEDEGIISLCLPLLAKQIVDIVDIPHE